ncbi:unnamed protein product [Paramecium octaurelia]|uniref:Uncharacterized protein n=1 Tax=Paramecium octaurelia TaxID=43137 RepID=A0A8S1XRR3_PAROT|nr:unnamed protein product [Paramecium octaurelia]
MLFYMKKLNKQKQNFMNFKLNMMNYLKRRENKRQQKKFNIKTFLNQQKEMIKQVLKSIEVVKKVIKEIKNQLMSKLKKFQQIFHNTKKLLQIRRYQSTKRFQQKKQSQEDNSRDLIFDCKENDQSIFNDKKIIQLNYHFIQIQIILLIN